MITSDEKLGTTSAVDITRRLWPALKPYRTRLLWGVLLIVLTTTIEILLPLVVGRTVDATIEIRQGQAILMKLCVAFFVLIVLKMVLDTLQAYVIQSTGQGITHDLRSLLFARIARMPVPYFDKNPTGRLLTRVVNDIKSLSELFTASISVLALDIMVIAGTILAMFWMNWKLSAYTLLSFPLVVISIRYFGYRLAIAYRKIRIKLAEINAFLGENIGAIATIQRLSAEKERLDRFERIVLEHQVASLESLKVFASVQPVTNSLNGVAMAVLLIVGGKWVIEGQISIGLLVAFIGYLRNLFQPIRDLVEKYNTFLSAMVSAERVVNILEEPTEEEIFAASKAGMGNSTRPVIAPQTASIVFESVSFKYPSRDSLALENVSFELPAGRQLAVVGATGSGKSTLIRLLLRFYEPTSGQISFGGRPLDQWDRFDLRRHIGVVHQEIYLFQGTVRENLGLGKEGFTDQYLRSQCERAQLWDVIKNRGGLDMIVNEGGTNFSLGERQLISFARILVFDTPLLVLDEATSSVDTRLEKRLMEAIHEILSTRTSIVIAHRLSTIQECDDILVLDHGLLKEQGTYDSLLTYGGIFKKFHDIHSRS